MHAVLACIMHCILVFGNGIITLKHVLKCGVALVALYASQWW